MTNREALDLVGRRHPEWREHELRWRWLLDSLEGGERYRQAIYGGDRHGLPIRNLIRHKHEYPDPRGLPGASGIGAGAATYLGGTATGMANALPGPPVGTDQAQFAADSDYELRRARTPVPTFVAEAVDTYCSKIYSSEIDRDLPTGPPHDALTEWWADVDGLGTPIDDWMGGTVARLILTLGHLDLAFDHPAAPDGTSIATEADAVAAGVERCVASYILPENMLWWRLDSRGRYVECLVREYTDAVEEVVGTGIGDYAGVSAGPCRYRHWTATDSTLYDDEGNTLATVPHGFGRVPIVRVFDRRKPRCRNVGQSRMESIAERQREYYNRDSELILSDTTQAHALLQGPEDFVQADGTIPIGPANLLPMKKNSNGGATSYEGFSVIEFPKGGADSLRLNKADIRDDVDRDARLTKPAGSAGTSKGTVGQSGVSKQYDHDGLHSTLSGVAKMLAVAERTAAEFALCVLTEGKPPKDRADAVKISYPTVFSLYAAPELAEIAVEFQGILAASGDAPETEAAILGEIVRKALPGRDDATYETYDGEIEQAIARRAERSAQAAEGLMEPPAPRRLAASRLSLARRARPTPNRSRLPRRSKPTPDHFFLTF